LQIYIRANQSACSSCSRVLDLDRTRIWDGQRHLHYPQRVTVFVGIRAHRDAGSHEPREAGAGLRTDGQIEGTGIRPELEAPTAIDHVARRARREERATITEGLKQNVCSQRNK